MVELKILRAYKMYYELKLTPECDINGNPRGDQNFEESPLRFKLIVIGTWKKT